MDKPAQKGGDSILKLTLCRNWWSNCNIIWKLLGWNEWLSGIHGIIYCRKKQRKSFCLRLGVSLCVLFVFCFFAFFYDESWLFREFVWWLLFSEVLPLRALPHLSSSWYFFWEISVLGIAQGWSLLKLSFLPPGLNWSFCSADPSLSFQLLRAHHSFFPWPV